ncbi:hypothetical protein G6F52_014182 [Rhizopus delemar]|nr:hypothetical protein G6F52_014182 [Rhizopus delemar]
MWSGTPGPLSIMDSTSASRCWRWASMTCRATRVRSVTTPGSVLGPSGRATSSCAALRATFRTACIRRAASPFRSGTDAS